jgi:hypothetical protein
LNIPIFKCTSQPFAEPLKIFHAHKIYFPKNYLEFFVPVNDIYN